MFHTCSVVNGSQYIHGVAFVFLKRSSKSRSGGSFSFFLNFLAENYKRHGIIMKIKKSKVKYCNLPGDEL